MSRWLGLAIVGLLWCAVLASAGAAIYCTHTARGLFVDLEALTTERDRLQIEWGQLQLEQSALSSHGFVERVASQRLQMIIPAQAGVEIVRQ
jgi:cell division protein FtsL